jgi:hypothetical protein
MRRGLGLLPLVAVLLALTGCHDYWGTQSTETSGSGTVTRGPTEAEAAAAVRNAIPAIEAYGADHGSYNGLTIEVLRSYDRAVGDVSVVMAGRARYCIESSAEGATFSFTGPRGKVIPVACGTAPLGGNKTPTPPPPPSYDAQTNVRAAIPAIGAYYADNGTYVGMTVAKLRRTYDAGLPDVKLVRVREDSYCVESSAGGETWSYHGPRRGLVAGRC